MFFKLYIYHDTYLEIQSVRRHLNIFTAHVYNQAVWKRPEAYLQRP